MTGRAGDDLAGLERPASGLWSPSRSGKAVLADLYGAPRKWLESATDLERITKDVLRAEGFTVISSLIHTFPGQGAGITGLFILSESHAAFHSYPEFGYLAVDLFTCGDSDPRVVVEGMAQSLGATCVQVTVAERSFDREAYDPASIGTAVPAMALKRSRSRA